MGKGGKHWLKKTKKKRKVLRRFNFFQVTGMTSTVKKQFVETTPEVGECKNKNYQERSAYNLSTECFLI